MQKKLYQRVGDKFINDTLEYRKVSKYRRLAELRSIVKTPKSGLQFSKTFKTFPQKYAWNNLNKNLTVQTWLPHSKLKPKAIIIYYPSFTGHAGISAPLAEQLSKSGFAFTTYDYPNFGQSETTKKGHIDSYQELIDISNNFLLYTRAKFFDIPIFITGFSAGSLIALHAGIKYASIINGCLFFNPFFQDNSTHNKFLKKLTILGSAFLPNKQKNLTKTQDAANHYLKQYRQQDDLMCTETTSGEANALQLMTVSRSQFQKFSLPYLCIQGGTDKIVDPFAVFEFEKQTPTIQSEKQTVIIHNMWHQIWFDDQLDQVINMANLWIKQRV